MLLEGLPHERLACLCEDATELKELVDLASPLLEIQRLEIASQDVTPTSLRLLERLELVLAHPADAKSPQRANVIYSQAHTPTREKFSYKKLYQKMTHARESVRECVVNL